MNDDLAAHLQSLEEELLQPQIRADLERVAPFLADDFREFGSSGHIFTKEKILAELATESSRDLTLGDFACTELATDVSLVTDRSIRTSRTSSTAADEPPVEALRSSLWVLRDGRWQMLFHQGTRI